MRVRATYRGDCDRVMATYTVRGSKIDRITVTKSTSKCVMYLYICTKVLTAETYISLFKEKINK